MTVSFTETANLQFKPLVESVEDHNNHQELTWGGKERQTSSSLSLLKSKSIPSKTAREIIRTHLSFRPNNEQS